MWFFNEFEGQNENGKDCFLNQKTKLLVWEKKSWRYRDRQCECEMYYATVRRAAAHTGSGAAAPLLEVVAQVPQPRLMGSGDGLGSETSVL